MPEAEIKAIEKAAKQEVDAAVEASKAAAPPPVDW